MFTYVKSRAITKERRRRSLKLLAELSGKLKEKSDIKSFSMDLGIVAENDKTKKIMRLVHFKTGSIQTDQYSWEEIPDSDSVKAKEEAIK